MYRKHPNHTYGRNRNDSANNWAIEATAICFEIRIPKKKNKELLWKVPSKIYGNLQTLGNNLIKEKNKTKIWFVNITEYHHREMGLISYKNLEISR